MTYRVIKFFTDLQDHGRPYNVGDIFPREGLTVSAARIAELSSGKNRQGVPLIKAEPAKKIEREAPFMNEPEPVVEDPVQETEKPVTLRRRRKAK